MATTKKKVAKKPKSKASSPLAKKPQSKQAQTIEELRQSVTKRWNNSLRLATFCA